MTNPTDPIHLVLSQSLHHAQSGDWKAAHDLIDDLDHPLACWLHASLHREEGDRDNASYWYTRAGKSFCEASFAQERAEIAAALHAAQSD